ncbi:MAG: hypothetical protein QG671_1580 [Actinomycetota bacterium]|nr:hypothetical protein [Actinomycetota bacterium]
MGRGRAKAKQTKVARQLKYNAPQTDLDALRAELSGASGETQHVVEKEVADDPTPFDDDPYDRYADDEDDDEPGEPPRRD